MLLMSQIIKVDLTCSYHLVVFLKQVLWKKQCDITSLGFNLSFIFVLFMELRVDVGQLYAGLFVFFLIL